MGPRKDPVDGLRDETDQFIKVYHLDYLLLALALEALNQFLEVIRSIDLFLVSSEFSHLYLLAFFQLLLLSQSFLLHVRQPILLVLFGLAIPISLGT